MCCRPTLAELAGEAYFTGKPEPVELFLEVVEVGNELTITIPRGVVERLGLVRGRILGVTVQNRFDMSGDLAPKGEVDRKFRETWKLDP